MADPKPPAGITETCRYDMYSAALRRYSAEEQTGSSETSNDCVELRLKSMMSACSSGFNIKHGAFKGLLNAGLMNWEHVGF